jgi:hypothetical protein
MKTYLNHFGGRITIDIKNIIVKSDFLYYPVGKELKEEDWKKINKDFVLEK